MTSAKTEPHDAATSSAYDRGLATRTQVMGEAFVEAAFANATPFTAPIQEHITRAAWGSG